MDVPYLFYNCYPSVAWMAFKPLLVAHFREELDANQAYFFFRIFFTELLDSCFEVVFFALCKVVHDVVLMLFVQDFVEEVVDETPLSEKIRMAGLTKTEINRTSTAELQKMANQFGIDGADEMSGNQIKKMFLAALED